MVETAEGRSYHTSSYHNVHITFSCRISPHLETVPLFLKNLYACYSIDANITLQKGDLDSSAPKALRTGILKSYRC
jgi:hypothetical protein